ncbi:MAG: lytic transglycosylase domain-containing protein [Alphaproteobacteria bacterium]|nr:lytic transglycosylase domain-containing protein [Alphaproteobacteria bacterium]
MPRRWPGMVLILALGQAVLGWQAAAGSVPEPKAKPAAGAQAASTRPSTIEAAPPPAARLVPPAELAIWQAAISAAESGNLDQALIAAGPSRNEQLRNLVEYLWIVRSGSTASIDDIRSFLERHPDWPGRELMTRRAEILLAEEPSDARVLGWYGQRTPVLGEARLRLGEALIRTGRRQDGERLLREGWIAGNFGPRQESDILQRHAGIIGQAHHIARLDRLLWNGERAAARRMLARVGADWRALAEARLALQEQAGNVDRLIARVPTRLKDHPGLVYERVRWRRLKGLDEDSASLLLAQDKAAEHAERWWIERQYHTRRALAAGAMSDAYRLASRHGLESPRLLAEAEWLAGWIALRFLNEPATALRHFNRLSDTARSTISNARGAYWAGRAAEALGDKAMAARLYAEAAQHQTAFYGQLATARLGRSQHLDLRPDPKPGAAEIDAFERRPVPRAAQILAAVGQRDRLRAFLMHLTDRANTQSEHVLTALFAERMGQVDLMVASARRSAQNGVTLVERAFPLLEGVEGGDFAEKALVFALVRQESNFRVDAVSSAGALGLMQLMPTTARAVARTLGMQYSADKLVVDPGYNTRLGRHYLNSLIESYDGSYVLALAAYNAGPSRVQRWMREWGDPRRPDVDVVDWIELIPFSETRNYVQRVIEGLQVYRQLLSPNATVRLGIESDLRGNNPR